MSPVRAKWRANLPEHWLMLMQLPHDSAQRNMQHLLRLGLLLLLLVRVVTVYRGLTVVCCPLWCLWWRWLRMRMCVRMLASFRIALRWLMMMCIGMIPLRLLLLLLSLQLHPLLQVEHVLFLRRQLRFAAGLIRCHMEVTLVLASVSIGRRWLLLHLQWWGWGCWGRGWAGWFTVDDIIANTAGHANVVNGYEYEYLLSMDEKVM